MSASGPNADTNLVGKMKSPAKARLSNHCACFGAWPVVAGFAAFGALALACWATQLLTKLCRFTKWMAEYFLAACALHEAWTSADTFCLLPAASADTANDTTRAVASVEISSFFMSYLLCPKRHRNANSIAFVPNIFLPEIISTRSSVPSPH